MRSLAAGDREALARLVERHHLRLYRVALGYLRNREEALDVVQDTFVKALERAGTWDGRSEVGPWLGRIAVNQSIDRWRRRRRRGEETLDDGPEPAAPGGMSAEHALQGRELGDRIGRALKGLPERQRAIVVLRHYDDLSLEEIAQTLGLQLGTVKSGLHRALARLRGVLAEVAR
jgi:RNA polymerase sigma-70 factor (ECF subfamily)